MSETNIKTINGTSVLGAGNMVINTDRIHCTSLGTQEQCGTRYHHGVLMSDGSVQTWGNNEAYGGLGVGEDGADRYIPTTISFPDNSPLVSSLYTSPGQTSFAIMENGDLYGWGANISGQIGVGTNTNVHQPQKITFPILDPVVKITKVIGSGRYQPDYGSSYALDDQGRVFSWGYGKAKQLPNSSANRNTPVQASDPDGTAITGALDIECGPDGKHGCFFIIHSDGKVSSCGANHYGGLCNGGQTTSATSGSTSPTGDSLAWVLKGTSATSYITNVTKVIAHNGTHKTTDWGAYYYGGTMFLTSDDTVHYGGYNDQYQSANNTQVEQLYAEEIQSISSLAPSITPTDIAMGTNPFSVMAVIMSDKSVRMWGYNNYGQTGSGDTAIQKVIQSPTDYDGNTLSDVEKVIIGGTFDQPCSTYVIKTNGQILSTGYNTHGELGVGNKTHQNVFQAVYGTRVNGVNDIDQISVVGEGAEYGLVILKKNGTVWSFGDDQQGQMGTASVQSVQDANSTMKRVKLDI